MAITQRPELEPLPLPDEPGLLGGWGRKLELTVMRFLLEAYNTIMTPFWDARDNATNYLFQKIEDELKPVIEPLLDVIDDNPNIPPWVAGMTNHLRFSEPITFAAIAAGIVMASIFALAMGVIAPIQRLVTQEVDSRLHSARMSPAEALTALNRDAISDDDYHNHLSDGGWSEELEEAWSVLLEPLVGVGELTRLLTRGEISESSFNSEMSRRGYKQPEVSKIKTLLQIIPPLTDIIQMAVREAFTPDVVEKFQLHAELPPDMVMWAKKQGLSEDWSRAYWAGHWQLPSLRMGYEMLHRDEIDRADMEMLIKAHDVSPFWRDKLINISYRPYTRVDVRRMYDTGVIGIEEVYDNYRDLGSDHERATNLTAFTVALSNSKERDLTKSEVLYGYEHAFFNPGETDELLGSLGYDTIEVEYYKSRVDYKRWQATVKETVKYLKQQYIANQIDQQTVYGELGSLNLPAEQTNRYLREWDVRRAVKAKRLTADRLLKFRQKEVINDSEFTSEMSGLGYSDRYIKWYLDSIAD